MNLSTATKNARLQALAARADVSGAATLTLYTGTQPANADTAITDQAALCAMLCPTPIADNITDGALTLAQIPEAMATESGTATWARLTNGAGNTVADLTVGTDIAIASAQLYAGMLVRIDTAVITE